MQHTRVHLPEHGALGKHVIVVPRDTMRRGQPPSTRGLLASAPLKNPPLPIDWTKNWQIPWPDYGNVETPQETGYGDCMLCAGAYAIDSWTGMLGQERMFTRSKCVAQYLTASGGDNGLSEPQLMTILTNGVGGDKTATVADHWDFNAFDTILCRTLIQCGFLVVLMAAWPDSWLNSFRTGITLGLPAVANQNNGHAVLFNYVSAAGDYGITTWESHAFLDPASIPYIDASTFALFSFCQFNPAGYDAYGVHYDTRAVQWTQLTGKKAPKSPFPPATPTPAPTPGPVPIPSPPPTPTPFPEPIPPKPVPIPDPTPLPIIPPSGIHWVTVDELAADLDKVFAKLELQAPQYRLEWEILDGVTHLGGGRAALQALANLINSLTHAQPPPAGGH